MELWTAVGLYQSLHEPLRGSFTLHATHCGSQLHEHQKNEIHFLSNFQYERNEPKLVIFNVK